MSCIPKEDCTAKIVIFFVFPPYGKKAEIFAVCPKFLITFALIVALCDRTGAESFLQ